MSQVKFGVCLDEFAKVADMVPTWVGDVGQDEYEAGRRRCLGADPPRVSHPDIRQSYHPPAAKCGARTPQYPVINSAETDMWGLQVDSLPLTFIKQTPNGIIEIPQNPPPDTLFVPSVAQLDAVTEYIPTRLQPLPTRYYKD